MSYGFGARQNGRGKRFYSQSADTSGQHSDLDGFQSFASVDSLRREESKVTWTDEQRFKEDCAALAKANPELTEWLKEHGGRLV